MRQHKHQVNTKIAFTHVITRKRQMFMAALGVTVGIGVFIFMNSLMRGFDRSAVESLFKSVPHLRVYRDEAMSSPLVDALPDSSLPVITNPKIINKTAKIINPAGILADIKALPFVVAATPDVLANVYFNNGQAQVAGRASGVDIREEDAMFNLRSSMLEGEVLDLAGQNDGVILGVGIAKKLNVRRHDNITISSALGVVKVMKVIGVFKTSIKNIDDSKAYINIATAQQLLRKDASYITDIFVNVKDSKKAKHYVEELKQRTGYDVEEWETANASALAANKMRRIMALSISSSILLVAGFGIYNILNMTIMQKMNDIAILKAMGFSGWDVTKIFLLQAIFIGMVGVMMGWGLGAVIVNLLSRVYVGGDIGYFPIRFEPQFFAIGTIFGLVVTTAAGYFPARKAAHVDPVAIFRK